MLDSAGIIWQIGLCDNAKYSLNRQIHHNVFLNFYMFSMYVF